MQAFEFSRVTSGSTIPGATDWKEYYGKDGKLYGLYVELDIGLNELSGNPIFFTSLGGNNSHWSVIGATSIYSSTPNGFRVYIKYANGWAPTAEFANEQKWHINWFGIEKAKPMKPSFRIAGTTKNSVSLELSNLLFYLDAGLSIYRKLGNSGSWSKITDLFPREPTMVWQDTGLKPDTQYCYFIKAFNYFGESDSDIICDRTEPEPQEEPKLADLKGYDAVIRTNPPGQQYVNEAFDINLTYSNVGNGDAGPHSIAAYYDGRLDSIHRVSFTTPPGENVFFTLMVPWYYVTTGGEHTFKFVIDYSNEVPEINESNNTHTWTHTFRWF